MSASDGERWPDVERRTDKDRRSGRDRRNEAGWAPILVDDKVSEEALVDAARRGRRNAQAAYSGFQVGAALALPGGSVVAGCNVENATYGLTICAERVALVKALSDGHTTFVGLAVVADTEAPTPPCGTCRQLLWEYCGDIEIVLANLDRVTARHRLSELLPHPFDNRLLR